MVCVRTILLFLSLCRLFGEISRFGEISSDDGMCRSDDGRSCCSCRLVVCSAKQVVSAREVVTMVCVGATILLFLSLSRLFGERSGFGERSSDDGMCRSGRVVVVVVDVCLVHDLIRSWPGSGGDIRSVDMMSSSVF